MNRNQSANTLLALKLVALTATLAATTLLAGCNTVQGVGRDITAVGEGGQDMIDDATGSRSSTSRRN